MQTSSAFSGSLAAKVFGLCFATIHLPLICLALYLVFGQAVDAVTVVVIVLGATVVASAIAFATILWMVRPIDHMVKAIELYRLEGVVPTIRPGGTIEVRRLLQGVEALIASQEEALDALRRQADSDPLTGLGNRRWLNNAVGPQWQRARRADDAIWVIAFDLDHFKAINDTHGHATGDEVLVGVATIAQSHLRSYDLLARIGGEEFCIVIADTNASTAVIAAERLRKAIETWAPAGLPEGSVTASFGISGGPARTASFKDMLRLADEQLYLAKAAGRNAVAIDGKIAKAVL